MADNNPQTPEQIIADLKAQLATKHSESEAQAAIISKQDEQLAAARTQGANALSVITHEGKRYQVLASKFTHEGKVIKHHELEANTELVKQLVEQESGILQLVEDAKK